VTGAADPAERAPVVSNDDGLFADHDFPGDPGFLLDVDGLAAQRHVDDRLFEGAGVRCGGSPIDDATLDPDPLLGDRHLQGPLLLDDLFLDPYHAGLLSSPKTTRDVT
jgi:hypothetical protein